MRTTTRTAPSTTTRTRDHRRPVERTDAFPCAATASVRRTPRPAGTVTTTRRAVGHRAPEPRVATRRGHRPDAAVYWRRRVVAVGLALVSLGIARQAGAALGGDSLATPERRPQVVTYVVAPGDTLWSIAEVIAPDADPRGVVDQLRDARDSDVLLPGETITWTVR
jgi:nucleoid-associated protein YgaU